MVNSELYILMDAVDLSWAPAVVAIEQNLPPPPSPLFTHMATS